jgi:hypothetical protein
MFTLPWWAVALSAAVLAILLVDAAMRSNVVGLVGLALRVAIIGVIAWAAYVVIERMSERERFDERLALQSRALALAAQAAIPGSPLACIEGIAGEKVQSSCEKTLFATPETVAMVTSYAAARLALLADVIEFGGRASLDYEAIVPGLQAALAYDRYGFVAQVLATNHGCNAESCDAFVLFRDAGRIRANFQEGTFAGYVSRNSIAWQTQVNVQPSPVVSAVPLVAPTTGTISPVPPGFTLPSAASIPPVSIMTPEPTTSPQPGAISTPPEAPAQPPPRRPAARSQSRQSASPGPTPPVQIIPPAASGTSRP